MTTDTQTTAIHPEKDYRCWTGFSTDDPPITVLAGEVLRGDSPLIARNPDAFHPVDERPPTIEAFVAQQLAKEQADAQLAAEEAAAAPPAPAPRKPRRVRRPSIATAKDAFGNKLDADRMYMAITSFSSAYAHDVVPRGQRMIGTHELVALHGGYFVPDDTPPEAIPDPSISLEVPFDPDREARETAERHQREAAERRQREIDERVAAAAAAEAEEAQRLHEESRELSRIADQTVVARHVVRVDGQPEVQAGDMLPADHPIVTARPDAFRPQNGPRS